MGHRSEGMAGGSTGLGRSGRLWGGLGGRALPKTGIAVIIYIYINLECVYKDWIHVRSRQYKGHIDEPRLIQGLPSKHVDIVDMYIYESMTLIFCY